MRGCQDPFETWSNATSTKRSMSMNSGPTLQSERSRSGYLPAGLDTSFPRIVSAAGSMLENPRTTYPYKPLDRLGHLSC